MEHQQQQIWMPHLNQPLSSQDWSWYQYQQCNLMAQAQQNQSWQRSSSTGSQPLGGVCRSGSDSLPGLQLFSPKRKAPAATGTGEAMKIANANSGSSEGLPP